MYKVDFEGNPGPNPNVANLPKKPKLVRRMRRTRTGLAGAQAIHSVAESLIHHTHFNTDECVVLLHFYERIITAGPMDLGRFRDILHLIFDITDDIMLDLTFKAFDRDGDGTIDETEWVIGLSTMIRGTVEELIEWSYCVYDINGDGSLARDELYHCLKNCLIPGYGVDNDELDDCEKDIVEIVMKKLDVDHDGAITAGDFRNAVRKDPLLIAACGQCLPSANSSAAFLGLVTENFRTYRGIYGAEWQPRVNTRSSIRSMGRKSVIIPSRHSKFLNL